LRAGGARINARMGLKTWAAFTGTNDGALGGGDVAMREGELTPVLKALRLHGIEVAAIHHHRTGPEPTGIFCTASAVGSRRGWPTP
jgi:hypothetical protein